MIPKTIAAALAAALLLGPADQARAHDRVVKAVEFVEMAPPATAQERAAIYSGAKAVVTYAHGRTQTLDLAYHQLTATTEVIRGQVVGGLFDSADKPITDAYGQLASDAPDGQSLMSIPGLQGGCHPGQNALALVTQFEYRELPPGWPGVPYLSHWSKLPAATGLVTVAQDARTGLLSALDYQNVSFAGVKGGWIHCAASLSPWNTHLSSEEYEPDAKVRGGAPAASGTQDGTDLASFSRYWFGDAATANAYDYGLVPEITVSKHGKATVVKHRALGRIARELVDVQPDGRTAYMGDDGGYTGLFMFVADEKADLSAGTLYAARWNQVSGVGGGSATLTWIRLGHATDRELDKLVARGIVFADLFDAANADPADPSYTKVKTYTGTEWLRLKPGMEKAAAFLETRRYAALLGATTEFSKMEGITHDARDRKAFVVISRVETGMTDLPTDPRNDVRVARNDGGAIYELALGPGRDSAGRRIRSEYVASTMSSIPELEGGWLGGTRDAEGNRCVQEKLCGPDNVKYAGSIRTLFIGEDTSRRNNNYLWAFNLDTRKLTRILSVPMYAEATGLQVVEDANGFAYVMSSFQHPGEQEQIGAFKGAGTVTEAAVLAEIDARWDGRKKAAIGYVGTAGGALPAFRK